MDMLLELEGRKSSERLSLLQMPDLIKCESLYAESDHLLSTLS